MPWRFTFVAQESTATIRAYRFWEQHVNNRGGIRIGNNSYSVNITFINIGSTAEVARSRAFAACNTAHPGVGLLQFFLGPYSSALTEPVACSVERCNAVLLSSGAASKDLFVCPDAIKIGCPVANERRFRNMWGVLNVADRYYSDAVRLFKLHDAKSIALFSDDSLAWSLNVASGVRAAAKSAAFYVAFDQNFPKNGSNALIASFVDEIVRSEADVVVAVFSSARARSFLRSLRASRFLPKGLVVRMTADDSATLSDLDIRFILDVNHWNVELAGDDYSDSQYFPPSLNASSASVFASAYTSVWGIAPGGNIEAVAVVAGQGTPVTCSAAIMTLLLKSFLFSSSSAPRN